jgi:hypothetical protein
LGSLPPALSPSLPKVIWIGILKMTSENTVTLPFATIQSFFQAIERLDVVAVQQALAAEPTLAQQRLHRNRGKSPLIALFDVNKPEDLTPSAEQDWFRREAAMEEVLLAHGAPFLHEINALRSHSSQPREAKNKWWLFDNEIHECFNRVEEDADPASQALRLRHWLRALPPQHRGEGVTQAATAWLKALHDRDPGAGINPVVETLALRTLDVLFEFQVDPAVFANDTLSATTQDWVNQRLQAKARAEEALAQQPQQPRRRWRA